MPIERIRNNLLIHNINFNNHVGVYRFTDDQVGLCGYLAIHTQTPQMAVGATRVRNYKNEPEALNDVLQLSQNMSYKLKACGYQEYGSAKACIIESHLSAEREKWLARYAKILNEFRGQFVTGTDMGLTCTDIKFLSQITPYVIGYHADPSFYTAEGILIAIKSAANFIFSNSNLAGKKFAIQGLGKVGGHLLERIYQEGGKIFVTDVDNNKVNYYKKRFPAINVVEPEVIYQIKIDFLCPCAYGNVIHPDNVKELKCRVICGGANKQLVDHNIGEQLHKMGILYVPDYIANSGGLILVLNELGNKKINTVRIKEKFANLKNIVNNLIQLSLALNIPTEQAALKVIQ
ncbi:leucine dehydrogenase [Legionella busanensis]|uniref:Leucine dehydrogenase n=1 Tax=Legionella busanensis TaxID=190655 RepID=A0A378JIH4_9GAMM|nr:Glu/Leu/Phe/Val dehydrogenase family protein [Legionella busanensis]STX50995.1 leucine dehydrogenase [Legionella busanensis]